MSLVAIIMLDMNPLSCSSGGTADASDGYIYIASL